MLYAILATAEGRLEVELLGLLFHSSWDILRSLWDAIGQCNRGFLCSNGFYYVYLMLPTFASHQADPFPPNDAIWRHETFSFMMSHPWEIGSATAERAGQWAGGWVHPEAANSMAVSGLRGRKVLVGTGRAISAIFAINGLRK